ncbi:bifunctional PIG-L family deacetylase/class I SAM-dependent methyltransferase [Oerskovia sp. Root22]|uniref:bifunctional PIG-L family deacetylase/class I SAM-dependent methyltransferase n=1 Tax=Oerskovia sp. Root22 TaxID=1736494 RepID=UPI0006F86743|nr:bifunctional PIG-L family deacetylase/class I SAM-dependent methyltransferase [Oerskovia sp. Root22]KRC35842.1 hypothetical protein ASE15_12335 [Oerskovia sp. Root22]
MVRFDHRDAGTSEAAWRASGFLDRLPPLVVSAATPHLVVLAAHPDDEALGAAGLLVRSSRRGTPVTVVVATDGEGSHPGSPTHSPADLAARRRLELVEAVACLAPDADVRFLGLPDGGLREHRAALHQELSKVLVSVGPSDRAPTVAPPGRLLLCAPWRGDGHRDHRIAGEVAAAVAAEQDAQLVQYPIWWWHWASPDDVSDQVTMRRLTLTPDERAAKSRAVSAYRSQVSPLSPDPRDAAVVGPEMLLRAEREVEVFVADEPRGAAPVQAAARTTAETLPVAFFDDFYRGRSDPWGFETRWYERRKRDLTLAALPRPRFRAGVEIGCSTGVLTASLAARCDRMTGVDLAQAPLDAARRRLGQAVELLRLEVPREWPPGRFDLVVLSEVGYYFSATDLETVIDRALESMSDDGVLVACHWRHPVAGYPLGGDEVHAALAARPGLARLARHLEQDFVLDVLVRPPAVSVATAEGLA